MGYSTFVEKCDLSTVIRSYPQYMWITVAKLKNLRTVNTTWYMTGFGRIESLANHEFFRTYMYLFNCSLYTSLNENALQLLANDNTRHGDAFVLIGVMPCYQIIRMKLVWMLTHVHHLHFLS